jgi:hypothetical protein
LVSVRTKQVGRILLHEQVVRHLGEVDEPILERLDGSLGVGNSCFLDCFISRYLLFCRLLHSCFARLQYAFVLRIAGWRLLSGRHCVCMCA